MLTRLSHTTGLRLHYFCFLSRGFFPDTAKSLPSFPVTARMPFPPAFPSLARLPRIHFGQLLLITVFELKMDGELNIEHLVLTLVLWLYFPLNLPCIYMLT